MKGNSIDINNLQNKLGRPLIIDGAIGSLLQQQNIKMDEHLWSSFANITHPQYVVELHKLYIEAGADIITTNSFRTNPVVFKKANLKISNKEFVEQSVLLAKEAVGSKDIIIAGSNPPAEDCYQKKRTITEIELERNHKTHIDLLWDSGCDIILNETQSHFDEIKIICEHCSNGNIPYIISLFVSDDLKLLSGEKLEDILHLIIDYSPIAIGFNCIHPDIFFKISNKIKYDFNWGFYLNLASGNYTDITISEGITPDEYIEIIDQYLKFNPLFIGSCCGSTPKHTRAIKEYLFEKYESKITG